MATDRQQASAIVGTTGPFVAGQSDGNEIWFASLTAYSAGGTPGAYTPQYVDATHGLPVAVVSAIPAGANSIGTVVIGAGSASIGTVVLGAGSAAIGSVSVTGSVAVTGTFFQATQPVSAASLPLPSGAATAAKQPALGTAGVASTDVITVQGIASGVAQPISAASLPLPTGASTESTLSTLNGKVTACNTGAVVISSALPAGANSIGTVVLGAGAAAIGSVSVSSGTITTVSTVTTVGAVTAITNALPAGSNLIGQTGSYPQTDAVYSASTALTPKFAKISCASSGTNTLVAAVTSKRIRVLSIVLICNAAVNIYFTDGAAGTAIFADSTNPAPLPAQGSGFSLTLNQFGHFQTSAGVLLAINLSSAVAVSGSLVYVEV